MTTTFRLLLLLACLISVSVAGSAVDIIKTCESTFIRDFCIESLSANPASKGADLTSLATIAIRNAIDGARNASDYFTSHVKGAGENTPLGQCLATCAYNYGGALVNLDWAASTFSKSTNNSVDVLNMLGTANNKADTCLVVCDGMVDPIADEALARNDRFINLVDVAKGVVAQTMPKR